MTSVAPTLTTDRLQLTQPRASDLPAFRAHRASPRTDFVGGPFTPVETFGKFATMIGHWTLRGFGRYIMRLQDQPIGHVGPLALEDEAPVEMTWTLWDGAYEGKGFATEAARAVTRHLIGDLGWRELAVHIMPGNDASIRVAERLGATPSDRPAPEHYPGALCYSLTQTPA
ncbi:MAG: GNAT family N-acetyltransferase [Paracoccaceae bacterium]